MNECESYPRKTTSSVKEPTLLTIASQPAMGKVDPFPEERANLAVQGSNQLPGEPQAQLATHETSYGAPMDDDLDQAMDIDEECTSYQATIEQMELQDCSGSAAVAREASPNNMTPKTTIALRTRRRERTLLRTTHRANTLR